MGKQQELEASWRSPGISGADDDLVSDDALGREELSRRLRPGADGTPGGREERSVGASVLDGAALVAMLSRSAVRALPPR
jgi:hypothetical protein